MYLGGGGGGGGRGWYMVHVIIDHSLFMLFHLFSSWTSWRASVEKCVTIFPVV